MLGLGEIIGSPFYGKVLDKYGHKTMIFAGIVGNLCAVSAIVSYVAVFKFNMLGAVGICFLWGF